MVANETDDNEVLHPKTKYTVLILISHVNFGSQIMTFIRFFFSLKFLQLHYLSLDSATFFMKLGEHKLGIPYTWAQNMCGLNFITSTKLLSTVSNDVHTQEMVPVIVDKMHSRLKARYQLYHQVLALEQQIYGNGTKGAPPMTSPTCILAQWSPITFIEYAERSTITNRFIDEHLVTSNHLLYHAVLIRGSAKMECFVSVSPNFPAECPIWAITLTSNGMKLHPLNSNDIKV